MAPTSVGGTARHRLLALASAFLIAIAAAQPAPDRAPPGSLPPPTATPELTPRALEADELDPATLARMALRFQLDQLALEVLGATRAPTLILGVALQGQPIFLEAYGSRTPGGPPASLDDPLWLGALGQTLTAVGELATGSAPDDDATYRAAVFDPLGMPSASASLEAGDAYEAATLPPHGFRDGVLEPLSDTKAVVGDASPAADRLRASARDLMAFAQALTEPAPPAVLAGGVRDALLADVVRDHPALPGRTPGFAASVLAGEPVLRRDGDPPGARASLVVLPEHALALFVYLNADAPPDGDPLAAASGVRHAPGALLEAILLALLGDARDPSAPERPWPAVTAAANPPAPGAYRVARYPATNPERALAALQPTFALRAAAGDAEGADAGDAVHLTPPAAFAEPITFARAPDGVWRSERDGAPLVSSHDGAAGSRLLLHLGSTLALERVAPLERRDVGLASWAAGIAAAILVLVSWPLGALLRWRRREPRAWDRSAQGTLGRTLRHLRVHSRINAVLMLALAAGVATLVATVRSPGAAPALADALPWLHAVAVPLALLLAITLLRTLLAAVTHPHAGWRWAWHALANLAFAAAWLQGWVWQLWSPAAIVARWLG
jgi:hypothetical protein